MGVQALEGVQGELNGLAEGCGRICAALAAARGASAELLSASERAAHDLGVSETRSALVEQFLQQYQLAPGEVAALQVLCLTVPTPKHGALCTPSWYYSGAVTRHGEGALLLRVRVCVNVLSLPTADPTKGSV